MWLWLVIVCSRCTTRWRGGRSCRCCAPRVSRGRCCRGAGAAAAAGAGLVIFFFIGEPKLERTRRRRRRAAATGPVAVAEVRVGARRPRRPHSRPLEHGISRLIYLATRVSAYHRHRQRGHIFHDAEKTFSALEEAVKAATHNVHMEYYIWNPDATGRPWRLVASKAREGVRCRLLLDFLGCWSLTREMVKTCATRGWTWPFHAGHSVARPVAVNFATTASGGGGRPGGFHGQPERRRRVPRPSHEARPWRTRTCACWGRRCTSFRRCSSRTGTTRRTRTWWPTSTSDAGGGGRAGVQVIPRGRTATPRSCTSSCSPPSAPLSARVRDHAYFVPDSAMILAFESAAYRGVRVQIIVPRATTNDYIVGGPQLLPGTAACGGGDLRVRPRDAALQGGSHGRSWAMVVRPTWTSAASG